MVNGVDDTGTEFYEDYSPDLNFWYKGEGSTLSFKLTNESAASSSLNAWELYITPVAAHPYHKRQKVNHLLHYSN